MQICSQLRSLTYVDEDLRLINALKRIVTNNCDEHLFVRNFPTNNANCAITNECRRIHANITNDLKRTLTNDNELGFSTIRQYAHDDVGSFSSMCEEALKQKKVIS